MVISNRERITKIDNCHNLYGRLQWEACKFYHHANQITYFNVIKQQMHTLSYLLVVGGSEDLFTISRDAVMRAVCKIFRQNDAPKISFLFNSNVSSKQRRTKNTANSCSFINRCYVVNYIKILDSRT